ncbi:MAG: HDIG domain-containing protein [Myxococcales bacterium]|nr:HDIG domain-containing protein [Myxococcales bacterium]
MPPEPKTERPNGVKTAFVAALISAAVLVALDALTQRLLNPPTLAKGRVAPFTVRARTDAVFDLRQSYAEEAAAARRDYLPIYLRDEGLLARVETRVVAAALRQPAALWSFGHGRLASRVDSGAEGVADDARVLDALAEPGPDARPKPKPKTKTRTKAKTKTKTKTRTSVASADSGADLGEEEDAGGRRRAVAGRTRLAPVARRELEALIHGFFKLLAPYYRAGVVADNEYPSQKKQVRLLTVDSAPGRAKVALARSASRYITKRVDGIFTFSKIRPALEAKAREFFFKSSAELREEVIDFIVARLPPNLTYAAENQRVIDISEVTGVKVVLIRKGEILARRGRVVGSRAYHAMRASHAAATRVSSAARIAGQVALLGAILVLFVVVAREVAPPLLSRRRLLLLHGGLLGLLLLGALLLAYLPVRAVLLPTVALTLVAAVLHGRAAALVFAITVPAALGSLHVLDLDAVIAGVAGGVVAALAVRRRRGGRVLPAGILVGLAQALAHEATRAVAGRPQSPEELLAAAQAFGGGIVSGLLATLVLPFVQRWLGQVSRGKLETLADFDHPLCRRLRERKPEVFASTVRVVNLADHAANAVHVDRLLVRCGALYHDVGKLESSAHAAPDAAPLERVAAARATVREGLRIAEKEGLPGEVRNLIAEHNGTILLSGLYDAARADNPDVDAAGFRYEGPKPSTPEAAVLMIACATERASRSLDYVVEGPVHPLSESPSEQPVQLIDRVIGSLVLQVQFDRCGLSQGELQRIRNALVEYVEENR